MIIIASINLNNFSEEKIRKAILTGADIMRFNFGYELTQEKIEHLQKVDELIEDLHSDTKILADLPTNHIRLGDFYDHYFPIKESEEMIFKSANYSADCNEFIPINSENFARGLRPNQSIIIGNGEVVVEILEIIDENNIRVKALNNGTIQAARSLSITADAEEYLKKLTEKIATFSLVDPDFVALPYLNKELNEKIQQLPGITRHGRKIIIKIDDKNGLNNLEEVCANPLYDFVMLDRGKMANALPYEEFGILQKQIIRQVKNCKKPLIVSTQILESTINNTIPSKADITDLTELILEKVDGIVLCKETDPNQRPAYTISVAKKIIKAVEKYQ